MTNFYEILEVSETSSIDEIKKSYRRLSMLYHPDKNKNNPESTSKFQKISEAYETLGDPEKKREYDSMRHNPFINMSNNTQNPMEDMLANLFGGGMPFGHMNSMPFGNMRGGGGQEEIDEILSSLFGAGMGMPPDQGMPPAPGQAPAPETNVFDQIGQGGEAEATGATTADAKE